MALEIFVTTASDDDSTSITLPDKTVLYETLEEKEEDKHLTIKVQELLESVLEQVQKSINTECEVEVSVSGKVSLLGRGGVSYLLFNVGGESAKETTMTIRLKSKVTPST